ncbi:MAG TPA: ABC transporter permease subunit [Candidatus Limnocylindrales bacterium]|jgi:arabinogalactan oligomer/maltooligosaccharide transport system permease protein|nr:ABC transporter permease subunit [Candidatus Limnocylindrales bacterium]
MTAPVATASRVEPVAQAATRQGRGTGLGRQLVLQLVCALIGVTVLFPIVWIVGMSLDPRNLARPDSLIPPGASLDAYAKVIAQPTLNPVSFWQLALNSLIVAAIISVLSVTLGVLAAYAFSRLRFRGREVLMIGVLAILMLPAVATIAPLFVSLNRVRLGGFNLGASLLGVALAVTSGQLPFAIWNMKGYLDTIPKELEEAATVDGASRFAIFRSVIVPLSTPVIAVTAFFGFVAGWTEFLMAQVFIVGDPNQWTLAVALNALVGQYAGSTPWSQFAAFSVLFALPVMAVYLFLQRYIVSGLTVGGVKG